MKIHSLYLEKLVPESDTKTYTFDSIKFEDKKDF